MTNKTQTWEVTVEEDPADSENVILPFPEDMLAQLGWVDGDTLNWAVQEDGTVILTKV
jgi:hypothetical protein